MPKKRFGVLCLSISPEGKHLLNVPEKPPSGWIIVRMDVGQENPIAACPSSWRYEPYTPLFASRARSVPQE